MAQCRRRVERGGVHALGEYASTLSYLSSPLHGDQAEMKDEHGSTLRRCESSCSPVCLHAPDVARGAEAEIEGNSSGLAAISPVFHGLDRLREQASSRLSWRGPDVAEACSRHAAPLPRRCSSPLPNREWVGSAERSFASVNDAASAPGTEDDAHARRGHAHAETRCAAAATAASKKGHVSSCSSPAEGALSDAFAADGPSSSVCPQATGRETGPRREREAVAVALATSPNVSAEGRASCETTDTQSLQLRSDARDRGSIAVPISSGAARNAFPHSVPSSRSSWEDRSEAARGVAAAEEPPSSPPHSWLVSQFPAAARARHPPRSACSLPASGVPSPRGSRLSVRSEEARASDAGTGVVRASSSRPIPPAPFADVEEDSQTKTATAWGPPRQGSPDTPCAMSSVSPSVCSPDAVAERAGAQEGVVGAGPGACGRRSPPEAPVSSPSPLLQEDACASWGKAGTGRGDEATACDVSLSKSMSSSFVPEQAESGSGFRAAQPPEGNVCWSPLEVGVQDAADADGSEASSPPSSPVFALSAPAGRPRLILLDLDNTLIPTSWIMAQWCAKHCTLGPLETVAAIRETLYEAKFFQVLEDFFASLSSARHQEVAFSQVVIVTNAGTRTVENFYLQFCLPELGELCARERVYIHSTEHVVKRLGPIPPITDEEAYREFYTTTKYHEFDFVLQRYLHGLRRVRREHLAALRRAPRAGTRRNEVSPSDGASVGSLAEDGDSPCASLSGVCEGPQPCSTAVSDASSAGDEGEATGSSSGEDGERTGGEAGGVSTGAHEGGAGAAPGSLLHWPSEWRFDLVSAGDQACEIMAACRVAHQAGADIHLTKLLYLNDPEDPRYLAQTPERFVAQLVDFQASLLRLLEETEETLDAQGQPEWRKTGLFSSAAVSAPSRFFVPPAHCLDAHLQYVFTSAEEEEDAEPAACERRRKERRRRRATRKASAREAHTRGQKKRKDRHALDSRSAGASCATEGALASAATLEAAGKRRSCQRLSEGDGRQRALETSLGRSLCRSKPFNPVASSAEYARRAYPLRLEGGPNGGEGEAPGRTEAGGESLPRQGKSAANVQAVASPTDATTTGCGGDDEDRESVGRDEDAFLLADEEVAMTDPDDACDEETTVDDVAQSRGEERDSDAAFLHDAEAMAVDAEHAVCMQEDILAAASAPEACLSKSKGSSGLHVSVSACATPRDVLRASTCAVAVSSPRSKSLERVVASFSRSPSWSPSCS
ncbi:hypothetical protein BESB_044940 [Besnoitia besnoiti]|uniref:Uncharacterized protein n=1 Tax=Besnoitia besnoiti TaxID=94643 RepID=A0A2A9MLH0_BESBE|nr:hypothetical protein BESB_044940 [Besnoitia besnoiti]PFH36302.1 hypothetical protein BESB_044940 [Besnoitia besnoiti]